MSYDRLFRNKVIKKGLCGENNALAIKVVSSEVLFVWYVICLVLVKYHVIKSVGLYVLRICLLLHEYY